MVPLPLFYRWNSRSTRMFWQYEHWFRVTFLPRRNFCWIKRTYPLSLFVLASQPNASHASTSTPPWFICGWTEEIIQLMRGWLWNYRKNMLCTTFMIYLLCCIRVFRDKEKWLTDLNDTKHKKNVTKNCLQWGLNSKPLDHQSHTLPTVLSHYFVVSVNH